MRLVKRLQRSQLSVQALSRLSSVCTFLLASWTDTHHLPLVALQGALLAIPYTLIEALVGRPLSAGLVPESWPVERWARRAAAVVSLPVAAVAFASASIALPETGIADRLLMITPVLLQLPLEATFWAAARTWSRHRANLVPQLTAAGTLLGGAIFALTDVRLDAAAIPAQVAVLAWVLLRRPERGAGPGPWASVRLGYTYCVAAAIDLLYVVALPSVAGSIVGPAAIVVLRAMELAFGPFHVALSATQREDVVEGRRSKVLTGTRVFTVVVLVAVSIAVTGSPWIRHLLATDLAAVSRKAVAAYCGYKAAVMFSTWLSTRHMIWAPPRRYLASAVGSRVLAFAGLAVSALWLRHLTGLFTQLLVAEVAVVVWYLVRMLTTPAGPPPPASPAREPVDRSSAGGRG
jgi:hypothetical protein